jgi:hypothetical protein
VLGDALTGAEGKGRIFFFPKGSLSGVKWDKGFLFTATWETAEMSIISMKSSSDSVNFTIKGFLDLILKKRERAAMDARAMAIATALKVVVEVKRQRRNQVNFKNHSGSTTVLMKMSSVAAAEEETGAKGALKVEENMSWQYNWKISFNKVIKMKKVKIVFMVLLKVQDDPPQSTVQPFLYPS